MENYYAGGAGCQGLVGVNYNTIAAPTISGISANPISQLGQAVYVYGSGFTTASQVWFTTITGAPVNCAFGIVSDSQLYVVIPNLGNGWAFTSSCYIWNQSNYQGSGWVALTNAYPPAPSVTSLMGYTSGYDTGGTYIEYTGNYFTTVSAVYLAGVPATGLTVYSDNYISFYSPAGPQQTPVGVSVEVVSQGGNETQPSTPSPWFTYYPNIPQFTSATNTVFTDAIGGSTVVTGLYFDVVTGVTVNGVAAAYTINSTSSLTITMPTFTQRSPGLFPVVISNASGSVSFNVTYNPNPPVITSTTPTIIDEAGGVENTVTISGQYLTNIQSVLFGSQPAQSFNISSDSQMTAVPPSAMSPNLGTETLTITNGASVSNTTPFTWTYKGYTGNYQNIAF